MKPSEDDWLVFGFRRKDHWQKHMKQEHSATRSMVIAVQKQGIPMAVLKDDSWVPVSPKQSETNSLERGEQGLTQ